MGVWCVLDLLGEGCRGIERGCVDVGNLRDMVRSSGGVVDFALG